MYQKFLVGDTDRFDATNFPQLQPCLENIVTQLNRQPAGPKADMLLSFVRHHSIASQSVADYPILANMISTRSLPTGEIEELFESGRSNPVFKNELDAYIRSYLVTAKLY